MKRLIFLSDDWYITYGLELIGSSYEFQAKCPKYDRHVFLIDIMEDIEATVFWNIPSIITTISIVVLLLSYIFLITRITVYTNLYLNIQVKIRRLMKDRYV